MKVGALIPCRTGSKGIPGKNFNDIAGKPLWHWTFGPALKAGIFDKIILSSDGGFTSSGFKDEAFEVIVDNNRPEEFSTDDATLDELLFHYHRNHQDIDLWCLLQPTSPLRTAKDITASYKLALKDKYDSIVGVTWNPCMFWIEKAVGIKDKDHCIATYHVYKRPNRQQRKEWFMENGAIYWTKKYVLEELKNRLGGAIGLYKMPKERSFEVDDMTDWKICESFLKGGRR
jgi:CMP-N-acetylneuraminic acid synthetase